MANLVLSELLKKMIELGGSDLHITTNSPPQVRVHGHLRPLDYPELTPADTKQLAYSVLTDAQKHRFEETLELDFSFGIKGLSRFRANLFNQRGAVAAVFRAIPYEIKSFEELGLPPVVKKLCEKPRGLILVTGPTGSGKSTTLAAMIDKINQDRHEHIITIEDPIEFLHPHKNCIVNQREVHADTHSFANALRASLREDPDVVLIGEMRDLETVETALRIAETGHLTFATLHTNSAYSTINRIIDIFPAHQQAQIRTQLSLVLEGVLCQALLPKASGNGRVMVMEILIPNAAIRNLIREDKIHQIYSMMQTGQEKYGMQTFNQALATAYFQRQITLEVAMTRSHNQDELQELINRGSGLIHASGGAKPGVAPGAAPGRPGMPGQRPGVPPIGRPPGR
ncbi:MAG: type IV pilus twitching motility protein PilT [Acidobacteriota bacterium]|nr:type IV pilus twitching motility protein PilT [Blastocatellia bacterium]MDW8413447.1 type IV pilus twitching motility protein PilT [Acidobacteriota bacterium]